MRTTLTAATAGILLLLAGCSAPPPTAPLTSDDDGGTATVSVSGACSASLAELENVEPGDFEAEDAGIVASLSACTSADEYLAGVTANPASWVLTGPEFVDGDNIFPSACALDGAADTPVCVDARADGYLD